MMKLDAGPILARKTAKNRRYNSVLEMCVAAGEVVKSVFQPFEEFCGSPEWRVSRGSQPATLDLVLAYRYIDGAGRKLGFQSTLSFNEGSSLSISNHRNQNHVLNSLSKKEISDAFVGSQATTAEQVFDAVVSDEPWRLAHILRWR